jgi:tetratricopeptide (TPR) repeat protein
MGDLSLMLQEQNRLEEALSAARTAEEILNRHRSSLPIEWAKQLNNVARILQALGYLDEAGRNFKATLALLTTNNLNERDQSIATCHNNLAMLLHDQGKIAESEEHYKSALQITKLTSGSASPLYGIFCKNLACLEQDRKQHHRALRLLELASRTVAGSLGRRHIEYAFVESRIGISYYRLGWYTDACQRFQNAFNIISSLVSPEHPEFLLSKGNLDIAMSRLGANA